MKEKAKDFFVVLMLYFLGFTLVSVIVLLLIALIKATFFNWGVC